MAAAPPLPIVGCIRSVPGSRVHRAEHALRDPVDTLGISGEEVARVVRSISIWMRFVVGILCIARCGTLARVECVELAISNIAVRRIDCTLECRWSLEAGYLIIVDLVRRARAVLEERSGINNSIAR